MELKKILIIITFILFFSSLNANPITPNEKLLPYDVVKIQLEALKNNNKNDDGIKVTWLFAHPNNKKATGPYERFRIMIYGQQYQQLLNHDSHKITLIMNTPSKHMFKIEILTKDKQLLFYEWYVEKATEENCNNCWFTSAVSIPIDQGNTI
jgi:hypothetical protein|tara:strand:- start:400 stop:855 length:456 start_codon:yes stop_codon:yes gene_type:complete